jgi:hypothetical protein
MEGGAVGHILKGTHPGTIPARLGLIWFSGFRGEDLNVKVYDVWRTPSDGKSSLGLWPGELKNVRVIQYLLAYNIKRNKMNCELLLTYDTLALRQTGSRNLMDPKTLPTIWGTYMKRVTKYQISAINSCWEKCDGKCAYMFNVYKNQLSRQTGSRNLTGPKTLPTIWHTYMKLVTKYQIPVINSCLEKCDEKCAYTNLC